MLRFKEVGFKRDRWILRNIDIEFPSGSIVGVVGRSGAGKTSLLKLAAGLLDATEGHVTFDDKVLIGPSEKLVAGYDDIQLVDQDFGLEPYHTVQQNIREKILSRHKDDQEELIEEFLALVELTHLREQKAIHLSGGEQQRLALARALACEPRMLLLDEPFVHLDQRLRWKVLNFLKELNHTYQTTIVLVSHDGAEVMGFADTVIYLRNGAVSRTAAVDDFYYQPESKDEAELMGQINSIGIDGTQVLFRPNEYEVCSDTGIEVQFLRAIDTGLTYFNYFKTSNGEVLMLSASTPMDEVTHFALKKRR